MFTYRFARFQDDGRPIVDTFQASDDDDAVCFGLRNRTADLCELYDEWRLLATFDALPQPAPVHLAGRDPVQERSALLADHC